MTTPTLSEKHFEALVFAQSYFADKNPELNQKVQSAADFFRALVAENERLRAKQVGVTLSAAMLHDVLDYINPDGRADADQLESEASIMWREEFVSTDADLMPSGYYAWDTAYPEEGLIGPLGKNVAATPPQAPAAGDDTAQIQADAARWNYFLSATGNGMRTVHGEVRGRTLLCGDGSGDTLLQIAVFRPNNEVNAGVDAAIAATTKEPRHD